MTDYSDLKTKLRTHEGCVEYMYLDTRGNVTVGIGHLMACADDAEKLKFVMRQGGSNARAEDIVAEYTRLKAQQTGQHYTYYEQFTSLVLPIDALEKLLEADIATTEASLRLRFRGYDTYPLQARSALLDMAFNLGVDGLANKFPRLKAAAESGDWRTCAAECQRIGIQPERNEWTKQQFLTAALARTIQV